MKDYKFNIEIAGVNYPLAFNLNVMGVIQEEYGSIDKWGKLTDGKKGEVNVKALIFGFTEMINEGLDIENDGKPASERKELLTQKQVGRLITEYGINKSAEKLNNAIVESTKSEEKNA